MTDAEVLERAIDMARSNGWDDIDRDFSVEQDDNGWPYLEGWSKVDGSRLTVNYHAVIFNHDFARALWGEEELLQEGLGGERLPQPFYTWQWYLQQMVISPDPIAYLGAHLPE